MYDDVGEQFHQLRPWPGPNNNHITVIDWRKPSLKLTYIVRPSKWWVCKFGISKLPGVAPIFSGAKMLCIHKVWCRKIKKESGDILPTHQRRHYLLVTFWRDFVIQQAGNVLTQLPFFILFGIFWGWTSPDFRRIHPNNVGLEGTGKASYIYVISITLSDQWRSCSPASSQTLASSCFTLRHTFSNNHGSGKLPFDWKDTRILEIHPLSTSIIMFSEGHMGLHGITLSSYIVFIVFQDKSPVV